MSEPIRVLQLFTIMNRGGAETMIMNYYRHIDRSKVQFDFMVHRGERGAYDEEIERLGGCIYRMRPISVKTLPAYKKDICRFFDEHKEYRIIHSNMSENGLYVFLEAQKRGIPVRICHAHNAPRGWDMKMIMRTYLKHRIRPVTTDLFACGSDAGIWLFGEQAAGKLVIMRNAIDTEAYQYSQAVANKVRREFELEDALVIGHVGSFKLQKNHLFLIDVFREITRRRPDARLLLVGGGSGEPEIRDKIKRLYLTDKVIFAGIRADVQDLLQAMDVFVLPSFFEGLSVAAVEAQAAGLPCVLSDTIPGECVITKGMVTIQKLSSSPEKWAEHILERAKEGHTDHSLEIVNSGYDIYEAAGWLQHYYLRRQEETKCQN